MVQHDRTKHVEVDSHQKEDWKWNCGIIMRKIRRPIDRHIHIKTDNSNKLSIVDHYKDQSKNKIRDPLKLDLYVSIDF